MVVDVKHNTYHLRDLITGKVTTHFVDTLKRYTGNPDNMDPEQVAFLD